MPLPDEKIEVGRCYKFSDQETREVLEIDGLRVKSLPHVPGGWGEPVWTPLADFAAEASEETQVPTDGT